MVIGKSGGILYTIVDPEVAGCQQKMNSEQEKSTIYFCSNNSRHKLPKEIGQDDTDNSDWRDNIEIPKEYSEARNLSLTWYNESKPCRMDI